MSKLSEDFIYAVAKVAPTIRKISVACTSVAAVSAVLNDHSFFAALYSSATVYGWMMKSDIQEAANAVKEDFEQKNNPQPVGP